MRIAEIRKALMAAAATLGVAIAALQDGHIDTAEGGALIASALGIVLVFAVGNADAETADDPGDGGS